MTLAGVSSPAWVSGCGLAPGVPSGGREAAGAGGLAGRLCCVLPPRGVACARRGAGPGESAKRMASTRAAARSTSPTAMLRPSNRPAMAGPPGTRVRSFGHPAFGRALWRWPPAVRPGGAPAWPVACARCRSPRSAAPDRSRRPWRFRGCRPWHRSRRAGGEVVALDIADDDSPDPGARTDLSRRQARLSRDCASVSPVLIALLRRKCLDSAGSAEPLPGRGRSCEAGRPCAGSGRDQGSGWLRSPR